MTIENLLFIGLFLLILLVRAIRPRRRRPAPPVEEGLEVVEGDDGNDEDRRAVLDLLSDPKKGNRCFSQRILNIRAVCVLISCRPARACSAVMVFRQHH